MSDTPPAVVVVEAQGPVMVLEGTAPDSVIVVEPEVVTVVVAMPPSPTVIDVGTVGGVRGDPGTTILTGFTPPQPDQGIDGDFYLDLSDGVLYGPKREGAESPSIVALNPVTVYGDTMIGPLVIQAQDANGLLRLVDSSSGAQSAINLYTSGGTASDALKLSSTNNGAAIGIQNKHASGFAGIEYLDQNGQVQVFTGYNNGSPGEFRFNNIGGGAASIRFMTNGAERLKVTDAGVTLAADPTAPLQAATKQYADTMWKRWSGTQAAYDAIPTKDPNTLYVVKG